MGTPDSELAQSALSGDPESFSELVRRHQDKIIRLCRSMVGEASAEDAAQDAFIKAYESLDRFRGDSAFSTWLYRIASNHCLNLLAKKKREKTESLDARADSLAAGEPVSPERSSARVLEERETARVLLSRLSADDRLILMLREMEGLDYRELAQALEVSMDTVKVRLFRARQNLIKAGKEFL